ncbi:hypothetical protein E1301_Tti009648 [Triplophysa tibetana]|uniref:Ig-like domain-containing protein n=1 Tax=Triplophysa tibetana TaxID=1572043 RepID=A0A5A9ND24_9TELE|nr:hypothetical protein E1301_Tti009648 [Triplophysa tibetana]
MNLIFSRGLRLIVEVPHVVFHHLGTPKVHILLPVQVQSKRPGTFTLACVITGLRSKAVRITWKVNETSGLRKHTSTAEVHRGPRGTFSAVGLYTVLAHKWSHENTYQCETVDVLLEDQFHAKDKQDLNSKQFHAALSILQLIRISVSCPVTVSEDLTNHLQTGKLTDRTRPETGEPMRGQREELLLHMLKQSGFLNNRTTAPVRMFHVTETSVCARPAVPFPALSWLIPRYSLEFSSSRVILCDLSAVRTCLPTVV